MPRASRTLAVSILAIACSLAAAREWTDSTGKFRVEAELVVVRSGKVILEKPDGTILTIPLDKLSAADQDFLKGQAPGTAENPFTPADSAIGDKPASGGGAFATLPAGDGKPGEVRRFKDLTWGVKSLAFAPSGGLLAAGKPDRAVYVFDLVENSRSEALEKLEILQSVASCRFTPDGSRLLAAGSSGHISIFSVAKDGRLKEVGQFPGHSQEVKCIAVSADGRFALSGSQEPKARYWDIEAGSEVAVFTGFEGPVKACHIAADGRTALATDGATMLEIDLVKREATGRRKLTDSWAAGQAAAFSPDGKLVAAGDTYAIRLFDTQKGKQLPLLQDNEIQWSMTFTPDGTRLLSGGSGKVNVWSIKKPRKIYSYSLGEIGYVQCLAASPDNKHAAAIASREVQVFRLPEAEK